MEVKIHEFLTLELENWYKNKIKCEWRVRCFCFCFVSEPSLHDVSTVVVIFIKFCVTITNFVCYLQGMEIFPTCLRQTGMSFANLAGNVAGVLAPYVVYLVRKSF
jgi:hypothetical protein